MIIKSCHIAQFGKWKERDFSFSDALNPFLWENGEGKTTLMHFFHIMFYGLSGDRKQDILENERKHYMPFQGGNFGGNIHFQEKGKNYILERSFGLKKAEDSFRLLEEGGKESKDYSENIGEEIFSLDSEAFQKVCMISHEDLSLQFNSSIHAKLGNVSDDREDMQKFQKVQNTLKDAINALSPNRRTGAIFKKKMEEESLSVSLYRKKEEEEAVLSLEEEVLSLEEQWKEKRKEEEKLEEEVQKGILEKEALGKKVEYRKLKEELEKAHYRYENAKKWYYQNRLESLSEEEQDRLWKEELQELKTKISALKKEAERPKEEVSSEKETEVRERRNPLVYILSGIALVFLILFFLKISGSSIAVPGSLSLLIAILLFAIAFAIYYGERERRNSDLGRRLLDEEKRRKEESLRLSSLEELLSHYHKVEEMLSLEAEEKERQEALSDFLAGGENKETVEKSVEDFVSLEEAQSKLERHRKEQELLKDQIREKREEREERVESLKALSEQERMLSAVREERQAMEDRIHILQQTKDYLERAKDAFASEYRGPILSAFSKYFLELTQSNTKFAITNDLEIEFIEGGMRRSLSYLSEGLQDLCRFAMKLAIFDAMFPDGRTVLFLDDPYSHFDDKKGERALMLLNSLSEKRQVFYFTCSASRMP